MDSIATSLFYGNFFFQFKYHKIGLFSVSVFTEPSQHTSTRLCVNYRWTVGENFAQSADSGAHVAKILGFAWLSSSITWLHLHVLQDLNQWQSVILVFGKSCWLAMVERILSLAKTLHWHSVGTAQKIWVRQVLPNINSKVFFISGRHCILPNLTMSDIELIIYGE